MQSVNRGGAANMVQKKMFQHGEWARHGSEHAVLYQLPRLTMKSSQVHVSQFQYLAIRVLKT